jgi:acyl carrier protein
METDTTQQLLALIERETGVLATEQTAIESLGIDSLDFISLIQAIQQEIGPVRRNLAVTAVTVSDLLAAIG